jgi:hypothetical protein
MAHAAERQNATQKRCKLRFARMPGRARHGRRGWAREANTKPMPRAQAHGGRNIGWRRGRRAGDTGVVRQRLMRVWETGVHEQSAGPQTRKYSPRPGVCPMESSQPPGEGSPRPRPGETSLRCHSPGGVLVGEVTRVPSAAGRKDTIRRYSPPSLGTFAFTPALRYGRRNWSGRTANETCSNRRSHGHFGFHWLGGLGECTSQYGPESLPPPPGGAAGVGMARRARTQ